MLLRRKITEELHDFLNILLKNKSPTHSKNFDFKMRDHPWLQKIKFNPLIYASGNSKSLNLKRNQHSISKCQI